MHRRKRFEDRGVAGDLGLGPDLPFEDPEVRQAYLDFLILAQSGKRVPLVTIKDIIDTWSRLIQQDNTFAEKLPPINLWTDGHQSAFIRDVYHELALLHFIQTFGEQGTWSRGNVSALLTPGITPAMILSRCRADVLFGINYTAFEVQQEPDDETQAN